MTEHKSVPDVSDKPVHPAPVAKAEPKDAVEEQKAKIKKDEEDVKAKQKKYDVANQAAMDAHSELNVAIKQLVDDGGEYPLPPDPPEPNA